MVKIKVRLTFEKDLTQKFARVEKVIFENISRDSRGRCCSQTAFTRSSKPIKLITQHAQSPKISSSNRDHPRDHSFTFTSPYCYIREVLLLNVLSVCTIICGFI